MPSYGPFRNYVQMRAREFGNAFKFGKLPNGLGWAAKFHFMYGINRPIKGDSHKEQFERVARNLAKVFGDSVAVAHFMKLGKNDFGRDAPTSVYQRAMRDPEFLSNLARTGLINNASLLDFLHPSGKHHDEFMREFELAFHRAASQWTGVKFLKTEDEVNYEHLRLREARQRV